MNKPNKIELHCWPLSVHESSALTALQHHQGLRLIERHVCQAVWLPAKLTVVQLMIWLRIHSLSVPSVQEVIYQSGNKRQRYQTLSFCRYILHSNFEKSIWFQRLYFRVKTLPESTALKGRQLPTWRLNSNLVSDAKSLQTKLGNQKDQIISSLCVRYCDSREIGDDQRITDKEDSIDGLCLPSIESNHKNKLGRSGTVT